MANINFFYQQYCTQFMTIDENEQGLFCQVPSESNGESYTVQVDESGVCPVVSSCSCLGYRHHGHCKHQMIVNNFYSKLYASSIVKANEKALEQAIDASDAIEQVYEVAELVEQIMTTIEDQTPSTVKIAQPVATPSITFAELIEQEDQMSLIVPRKIDGHSVRTASFFSTLPSRQKSKVA